MVAATFIDRAEGTEAPGDDAFSRWVNATLNFVDEPLPANPEISIRISTTVEMIRLNASYRGKDGATNVLSFPTEFPDGVTTGLLGDIVICADVVTLEAADQNLAPEDHWAHLTVHGVLHLLGFDHIEDQEALRMEDLEARVLAQLGISNPYIDRSQQAASTPARQSA